MSFIVSSSNCSLLGCRHCFVNMAVYLHTGQWSVNPLSQVVRPLAFGEISTTYKSRWYENDHYNPFSLECNLLIGQQLRPTHDSYDQHMTVTITQRPQLRPTDVFENDSYDQLFGIKTRRLWPNRAEPSQLLQWNLKVTHFPVSGRDCASWYCC